MWHDTDIKRTQPQNNIKNKSLIDENNVSGEPCMAAKQYHFRKVATWVLSFFLTFNYLGKITLLLSSTFYVIVKRGSIS